jgi:uncharacterized protein
MQDAVVMPIRHVIYLHGFSSSPASSKAKRFAAELARLGVGFSCPDLNLPAFETLTVTRMLAQTRAAVAAARACPVVIIGSSLGAFVAVHAAAADETGRIDRLVLLAPALDFGGNRLTRGPGGSGLDIEGWRRDGYMRVFHHADNKERRVGFGLYQDAATYDAFAVSLRVPALIFQGRQDASVNPGMVAEWAAGRPGVDLRLVDDDHQLGASFETIWEGTRIFCGLGLETDLVNP